VPKHTSTDGDSAVAYQQKVSAIKNMLQRVGVKPRKRLSECEELAMYARKVLKVEIASIDPIMQTVKERRSGWEPHLHLHSVQSKQRLRLCLELIDLLLHSKV